MPNSILEAMAFGSPVITCCTGGVDFFADEKMGYIIRPKSVDDIVNKLKLILPTQKYYQLCLFIT